MPNKQTSPFGSWPSPISPAFTSQRTRIYDAQWDRDGETLVWLEGRDGKGVLLASTGREAPRVLSPTHSIRAAVGYGGGEFCVAHGHVLYANQHDGRLYRQALGYGQPKALTPGFGAAASPAVDATGRYALYVHTAEGEDCLALIDIDEGGWPTQLARGADFYMSPCWHPNGRELAWIEWDHPNMPWDGSRLMWAELSEDRRSLLQTRQIAGADDVRVQQPAFSPDGRYLSYITTHEDLDALVVYEPNSEKREPLVSQQVLGLPSWVQGMRSYGWHPTGERLFYTSYEGGRGRVWTLELQSKASRPLDLLPYAWFEQLAVSPKGEKLALLASSPTTPLRLIEWRDGHKHVVSRSMAETLSPSGFSTPREITWKAQDQTTIHGLFYPPTSETHTGAGLPPAIIQIHGGPTSQSVMSFAPDVQFFTSRGFAVLEVNYRGSSGYGKAYIDALKGKWGVLDVEDAVGAARALAQQGLADAKRLVIKGGSAGGYTVLNALVQHPGVFCAGISLFGIGNLFTLASGTHKFESRYLDSLVGPLPESAAIYKARSPLFHAEKIQDPIAIFQGEDDRVVPKDQAEAIASALRANGTPHVYHLYPAEGHGWRRQETVESYYKSVLEFLGQYVLAP